MPLYDLTCECGYLEPDRLMSVAEYEKAMCPECGIKLKNKVYQMTFTKKGIGWTPIYNGKDRTDRTRDSFLAEETYEGHKRLKQVYADRERTKEKKPIYIT
jgi:predicted nucleic acid-binding Zn ribbon protein